MRVAFASDSGTHVDQHYGRARAFYVWEIGPDAATCVGHVVPAHADDGGDLERTLAARADAVADCAIVYSVEIGGPAAAKLVRRQVHPMRTSTIAPIADVVARLQGALRGRPPPWLRKLLDHKSPAPERAVTLGNRPD